MVLEKIEKIIKLHLLRRWYSRYERYLIPGALILGFLFDVVTFRLINFNVAFALLAVHLVIAGLSISFIDLYEANFLRRRFFSFLRVFAPLIVQYSFGAILSASIIFYSWSGSLFLSWPFILVLILLAVANEIFKNYYRNLVFQASVYFFCIFSVVILALPYFLNRLGPLIFISSGILSLLIIALFIRLLMPKIPDLKRQVKPISATVASIFFSVVIFYFSNIIPPFPLTAKEAGIYHAVQKTSLGNYRVLGEEKNFFDFFLFYEKFHITSSQNQAYAFTSIFSPAKLNLEIKHEWQFKNKAGHWRTESVVPFPIIGGRIDGYRGYSRKINLREGRWRVNIKTSSGQTIGLIYFKVIKTNDLPDLLVKII